MWYHDALFYVVNAMWFADDDDLGVTLPRYFKPVRRETIALVYTAVSYSHIFLYQLIFSHCLLRFTTLLTSGHQEQWIANLSKAQGTRAFTSSYLALWMNKRRFPLGFLVSLVMIYGLEACK
jgi:hypothetical protein